jgi:hypothetical protein
MRVLAVLAAFALAPRGARSQGEENMELVQVPDSDGTCQVFPAGMVADASDMGFCEDLIGANVMVFTSRGTLEEQYGKLLGMVAKTIAMAAMVSTPTCVAEFTTMICTTWFPPVRRLDSSPADLGAFASLTYTRSLVAATAVLYSYLLYCLPVPAVRPVRLAETSLGLLWVR